MKTRSNHSLAEPWEWGLHPNPGPCVLYLKVWHFVHRGLLALIFISKKYCSKVFFVLINRDLRSFFLFVLLLPLQFCAHWGASHTSCPFLPCPQGMVFKIPPSKPILPLGHWFPRGSVEIVAHSMITDEPVVGIFMPDWLCPSDTLRARNRAYNFCLGRGWR